MSFLRKLFFRPDYFAEAEKKVERLKASQDSQALILLMQDVQENLPQKNEDFGIFYERRKTSVQKIAWALAELGDPKAVEPVIGCLDKCSRVNQYEAYWWSSGPKIVARFGSSAVEPLITGLANTESVWMRDFTVSALGLIGDKRAIEPILREGIVPPTIWALGNIGNIGEDRQVIERLVEALLGQDDSKSEAEALFALASGKFGKLAEEILLPLLSTDRRKERVATALCAMGNSEGMETVLKNVDVALRVGLWLRPGDFVFLGRFNDPRVTERLTTYLDTNPHSEEKHEWVFAALGLAEQGNVRSVKPLVEALTFYGFGTLHVHPWYRHSIHDLALQALNKLGKPAIEELSKLAKNPDTQIKSQAEKLLQFLQSS